MKKITLSFSALALLAAFTFSSCSSNSTSETIEEEVVEVVEEVQEEGISGHFTIDTDSSVINWLGKKVAGEHYGEIFIQDGAFNVNDGKIVDGDVVVDMTSLTVTDIKDEETNAKLLGHLTTEDFFNVAEYPSSTLSFSAEGEELVGELTIKGVTKTVTFTAELTEEETELVVTGTLVVDRTEFGIHYGSAKLADTLKDKAINDEFELTFKIVAAL